MNPIGLHRLDPAHNMFRFYVLAIEPDLFGRFRLVRQWGRIGGRGGRPPPATSKTSEERLRYHHA